jgi:hypothetical protein
MGGIMRGLARQLKGGGGYEAPTLSCHEPFHVIGIALALAKDIRLWIWNRGFGSSLFFR